MNSCQTFELQRVLRTEAGIITDHFIISVFMLPIKIFVPNIFSTVRLWRINRHDRIVSH